MIDADLARFYGVTTKRLNEQVRRNSNRFPEDFMFRLTSDEKSEVVAKCDHLVSLKYSPVLPFVFTEHGALMLASVLRSSKAAEISIYIVRAFVRIREMVLSNNELSRKLAEIEKRYDSQFHIVFAAIRQLMSPELKPKRRIGFDVKGD
jgi:hypothetical protein